jgi:hypothetical protein
LEVSTKARPTIEKEDPSRSQLHSNVPAVGVANQGGNARWNFSECGADLVVVGSWLADVGQGGGIEKQVSRCNLAQAIAPVFSTPSCHRYGNVVHSQLLGTLNPYLVRLNVPLTHRCSLLMDRHCADAEAADDRCSHGSR